MNQNGPINLKPAKLLRELGPARTHPRAFFTKVRELLEALRGSRIIAKGEEKGCEILHFLLPSGHVLEIVKAKA